MTSVAAAPLVGDICETLRGLFPDGVAVGGAAVGESAVESMFHVKHPQGERMGPARRLEFLAGRLAAARAQRLLGLTPRPVETAADRSPVWPEGLIGSISHAAGVAVAVVARRASFQTLGVDVERLALLGDDVERVVLTPEELEMLDLHKGNRSHGSVFFSAKEAIYKAIYPLHGELAGYDLVSVRPEPARGTFRGRLSRQYGRLAGGSEIVGRYALARGLVLCGVFLSP